MFFPEHGASSSSEYGFAKTNELEYRRLIKNYFKLSELNEALP
jgi:hypothetical protein